MIVSDNKKYGICYKKVCVNNEDNMLLITLSIGNYVRDNKIDLCDIALIKLDEPGMTSYYDSFDSDEMIYSCNEKCSLDADSVFNKYKDKLGVYKHSFNMLNDETIYYLETQKIN